MLEDVAGIRRIIVATGFFDLRKGIDGLAQIRGSRYDRNPFEKGTLFLFCGRRSDRIKGLLWMGRGFLLLYMRLEDGSLTWPRTSEEAAEITEEQFHLLMLGLNPIDPMGGIMNDKNFKEEIQNLIALRTEGSYWGLRKNGMITIQCGASA